MSLYVVSYPDVYIDARSMLEEIFESNTPQLVIKYFNTDASRVAVMSHLHVDGVDDEEGFSNLDISIAYKMISFSNRNNDTDKVLKLRLLTTSGDKLWTYKMKHLVWDGSYPSTIAVDKETGSVFFVYFKASSIELEHFGKLTETQLEAVLDDLNDNFAFSIKIKPEAMFMYIDGEEGVRHLRENVYVEFNCGIPIKVFND